MITLGVRPSSASQVEIGRTSKGLRVVLTETDKYNYPEVGSGWGATTDQRGNQRVFNGKSYKHPGVDWVGPYGSPVLAGVTGTVEAVIFENGLWGTALAIRLQKPLAGGGHTFLIKYHLDPARSLKVGQQIEYHQEVGTLSDKGTYIAGRHTHEHVLIGNKIATKMVPHRTDAGKRVVHVYAEGGKSAPAGLVPITGAFDPTYKIFNPLDFYADADPTTKDVVEIAAIAGPTEANKYAELARGGIVLGSYRTART